MSRILLLASKSSSRKMLLEQSHIPFTIIEQEADEAQCDWRLPLAQLVPNIARHKMAHVILPAGTQDGEHCLVLTADTLSQDMCDNTIQGKPADRADAVNKIRKARAGSRLCTAFCLYKYVWRENSAHGAWELVQKEERAVMAEYHFIVPDNLIDWYLDVEGDMLSKAGAIAIEGVGAQFLQSVSGSHSAIIGLPLYELRQALTNLGFFDIE
jgi:septum formation protein